MGGIKLTVTTKYRVNYYDTDMMGVSHHSNYIRWFEIGRVEFLRSIGIDLNEMMNDGYLFPITKVDAQYHSPSHFDDVIEIQTTATALTKAKMEFEYEIFCNDKLLVTGHTQNVFTNKDTGKITRVTDKYEELMRKAQCKSDE